MKVLKIGQLGTAIAGGGVTGTSWGSGTSTPPIDLSKIGPQEKIGVWLSVQGDFGVSGTSVAVMWKGCYTRSGATYTAFKQPVISGTTGNILIKTAKTTGGFFSNGSYLATFQPCMPWLRLEAIETKAGSTNAGIVKYAICAF